jgi:two-component system sensor histidine kinase DegS
VAVVKPGAAHDALGELTSRLRNDLQSLDAELAEIDLLVQQARVEAERHELKRAQAASKLGKTPESAPAEDVIALTNQLVTLTRRATLMESQVEVLDGKRKILARFREALGEVAAGLGADVEAALAAAPPSDPNAPPSTSRIILTAQEDLRREIARAMHDGPAQSLTNIVLQAQIVDRLMPLDPDMARGEVRQLISMVQQTLDATKSFIFDVRPMVLDDLGLVPTVRRSARERGRRAGIAVEFESLGADRRMPVEMESGLFRIIDEALAAYLQVAPDRVVVQLDWTEERVEGHVTASRERSAAVAEAEKEAADQATRPPAGKDVPPALAAMMDDRRVQAEAAAEAARAAALVVLPASAWQEIEQRANTLGITVELLGGGGDLRIAADLPAGEAVAGQ